MFNTAELKFKEKGQLTKWEDLPVVLEVENNDIDKSIAWIKRMFQCVEIRWNYEGSPMGHYVDGNVSRYERSEK